MKAGGAGMVVGFFAVIFVHFFLLLAGLTRFLLRLQLLLLARLRPAAALLLIDQTCDLLQWTSFHPNPVSDTPRKPRAVQMK